MVDLSKKKFYHNVFNVFNLRILYMKSFSIKFLNIAIRCCFVFVSDFLYRNDNTIHLQSFYL